MVDGKLLIEKLLVYAKKNLYLSELDVVYKRNQLLMEFRLSSPYRDHISASDESLIEEMTVPDVLFSELKQFLIESELCSSDDVYKRAVYVMGILSPLPSEVNVRFKKLREQMGADSACNYLYDLSIKNNYVEKTAIEQNFGWKFNEKGNAVEITVNMSKPEKDNAVVKKEAQEEQLNGENKEKYPSCVICQENQGFYGNSYNPSRSNLRAIELELSKEQWFLQFSPYGYLEQHCIMINGKHTPMNMQAGIIDKLFDFIEYIPQYFVGSNSDLPIIGGSILSHEHFQGGKKILPLFNAKTLIEFRSEKFPDVEIMLTDWYTCDVRVSGFNRNTVKEVFSEFCDNWKNYSEPELGIINSEEERHNSLTVIARYLPDGRYCVDIIPRNNATSEESPNGIFHVPTKYQNIKKEALGIMEISGLFILPSRLKNEIAMITDVLMDKQNYNATIFDEEQNPLHAHKTMIEEIVKQNGFFKDAKKAETAIHNYIGKACVIMLQNSSVFKMNDEGELGLRKFLAKFSIK